MHYRSRVNVAMAIALIFLATSCGQDQPEQGEDPQPRVYVDPNGYFKIVPPPGWKELTYANDPRGKIAFLAAENHVELRVLAKAVPAASYDEQFQIAKSIEAETGIPMNVERIVFNDIPAIQREATLTQKGVKMKYLMVDLRIGGANNNLQFGAPEKLFDKYRTTAWLSMLTYEPLEQGRTFSPEEIAEHEAAKWIRMTRIAIEMGDSESAKEFVQLGLESSPENVELKELLSELEK